MAAGKNDFFQSLIPPVVKVDFCEPKVSKVIGTLRMDNKNADVNPRELGRDVAIVVDVVDHFFLPV